MSEVKEREKHVIFIDGSSQEAPWAECTCGWKTEPTTEMMKLGTAAFNHRDETGHGLRNNQSV